MAEAPPPTPTLDPETLDRLRRGFPLEMDAMGRFFYEGDALDHPRVVRYFRHHLDVTEAGEPIVLVDGKWVHIQVADCPLRVLAVVDRQGIPHVVLDDLRALPLGLEGLLEREDAGLRCEVPARQSGRPLRACFTNPAQMQLMAWIDFPDEAERPTITVGEQSRVIPLEA